MMLLHYSSSRIFSVTASFIHYSSFEIFSEKKIYIYYNIIKIESDDSINLESKMDHHRLCNVTIRYEVVEEETWIKN